MSATVRNILAVARREFLVKARTRTFVIATAFLAIAGVLLALAPIGLRWFEGEGGGRESVGVVTVADPPPATNPVGQLATILNASAVGGESGFAIEAVADEAAARAAVDEGDLSAALVVDREAGGDLTFLVISNEGPGRRTPELLRQASLALAVSDRLDRLGVAPGDQATLFAPADVTVETPTAPEPGGPSTPAEFASVALVGQALVVFLLLAVVLYGQWVATSAAEEKSSRVMEIVISAATPFQLLGGKVIGVGGLGLVQLAAAVLPALAAFALQGPIAEAILGGSSGALELPQALRPDVLAIFAVFFVLGYLLYATLYAAGGAMVSRMEDVNTIVTPMSMVATLAYLVAIYASIGIVPTDAPWVTALAFVPFTSPFLMLSLYLGGAMGPGEIAAAIGILVVSIVIALWVASRVYAAGVLMYGQSPSFRRMLVTAFGRGR
jgi:ABC-2 type transport system permease protein